MSEFNPNYKTFAEKFGLNYESLAKEAPQMEEFAAAGREAAATTETQPKPRFEKLPDGKYNGKVYIDIKQVDKETNPNYNRLMLKFTMKVSDGERAGNYDYKNLVVNPSYLDAPKSNQSEDEWKTAKEEYWNNMMKTLQNCGVAVDRDNELATFSNTPEANGNIVQFSVKSTASNRHVYIDKLIERAAGRDGNQQGDNQNDSSASLLDLPNLPDGSDAPFGEETGFRQQ